MITVFDSAFSPFCYNLNARCVKFFDSVNSAKSEVPLTDEEIASRPIMAADAFKVGIQLCLETTSIPRRICC